jgi:tripartite-type tricarboxylate transporter receptor subunit TctC
MTSGGYVRIAKLLVSLYATAMMVLSAGSASGQASSTGSGQAYPSKPVRIVTSEAGGLNDFTARMIAPGLSNSLGQPVIVENRGVSSIDIVGKALPDGYSVICYANNFWLLPFLQDTVTFDPIRDFAPVTLAVTAPNVMVVHPSVAANSVKELIALAKAKPRTLNYGAGATGGTPHLAAELFKNLAGVNVVRVNYKGTGPAIVGIVGGEVQMMFATPGGVNPHVKAGKLKAVGVTSLQATALAPGLSPLAEQGLPGYEAIAMTALLAPARTPAARVNRLSQEMARAMQSAEVKERFFNAGAEVVGSSPEQLLRVMKSEMPKWSKIIKESKANE